MKPQGVHLVGSLAVPSVEVAFLESCAALPGRLKRIPDGEPKERSGFILWQFGLFPEHMRYGFCAHDAVPKEKVEEDVKNLGPIKTGYDKYAVESYQIFKSLKSQGKIPGHVRFQVCLPSPVDALCAVWPEYRAAVDPIYRAALENALHNIVKAIPSEELAIQIDCAASIAMLEDVPIRYLRPYFTPVKDGLVRRILSLVMSIPEEVELGFHLCYGDRGQSHFVEPKDLGTLVSFATELIPQIHHHIAWIHMPVPKSRDDEEYFEPLTALLPYLDGTALYLGLVHVDDLKGTEGRIATASKVVQHFGVASECGFGRRNAEQMASMFAIAREVCTPYQ